ncbi:MAG: FeoA family protein [Anaerolineaceae bacterium]|nr:FeoA family protein [Anaerolineaceae bacterium]
MVLLDAPAGSTVRILGFEGGRGFEKKMRQVGLMPGDCARVLRQAPFDGPFLVEVRGREIALGKGVASQIIVEKQPCDSL